MADIRHTEGYKPAQKYKDNGDGTWSPVVALEPDSIGGGGEGGGLTDEELRAVPVPVSGTVSVAEPVSIDDNGGSLTVDGTVAVSNFPATQPVSGTVAVSNFPAAQPVTDNGGSLTVDGTVTVQDGGGSLTVDGPLTDTQLRAAAIDVSGSEVSVTAGDTLPVASLKQDLTAAAPDDYTVTTSSAEAVALNANRKGCIIINVGTVKVSLGLDGNTAVLNKGITLGANGAWTMGEYDFTTGQIQAIADTGGSTLAIQEFS